MRLFSVEDPEFAPYGAVLRGYDFSELLAALARKPVRDGIVYEASDPVLERCAGFDDLRDRGFGGLPIQIGCVSADNRTLNCLEYHKSSEFNIAYEDVILVLGMVSQIRNGRFDTAHCKAFRVPAGCGVELYGTTLHYAPFSVHPGGYRIACVLPRGTNGAAPAATPYSDGDRWLYGCNKWIATFPDTADARGGIFAGLSGVNITQDQIEFEQ